MKSYRMIDVHCHLDDPSFESDLDSVINDAKSVGVEKFVLSALVDVGIEKALQIAITHPCVRLSIGAQPQSVNEATYRELILKIEGAVKNSQVIALGEVGIDRGREGGDISLQEKFFREAIRLASSRKLPLIVHSRGAGREAIKIIADEKPDIPVDMHAFDGRVSTAFDASKKGLMFSIPPSIARSEQKRALASRLPLSSIMLESDAPALGPDLEKRNVPSNLVITVRVIAQEKKVGEDEVADFAYKNSHAFFLGRLRVKLPASPQCNSCKVWRLLDRRPCKALFSACSEGPLRYVLTIPSL